MLESGMHPKEISEKLNIPSYIPGKIKSRETWTHISCNYSIPLPGELAKGPRKHPEKSKLYSPTLINAICKYLESGESCKVIANKLNVPNYLVYDIKGKRAWTQYSQHYNIPEPRHMNNTPRRNPLFQDIYDILNKYPDENYSNIIKMLGIPDTQQNRQYIAKIKYRYHLNQ